MNTTLNFKVLRDAIARAKSTAFKNAKAAYPFVGGRGGALLCTADTRGGQSLPNVAADCPFWDGKKSSIEALVADVQANHPDVDMVYIEGAYDGGETIHDWRDSTYDPRVEEWEVMVWTRADGYVQQA